MRFCFHSVKIRNAVSSNMGKDSGLYIIGVEIVRKELSFSSFLFAVSYFSITFA